MMKEKHIKLFIKLLLFGILLSFLASCTIDGDDEFSLPRDKYLGKWTCQTADGAGYHATISSDPSNSTQVIITNFFSLKGTVTAIVTDETITVTKQKMQGIPGTYMCEGLGSLSKKNGIYTIYWILYAAGIDETTCTYTKKE